MIVLRVSGKFGNFQKLNFIFRMNEIGQSEQRNPSEACLRVLRGHLKGVYPVAFVPVELEENLPIGEDVQVNSSFGKVSK